MDRDIIGTSLKKLFRKLNRVQRIHTVGHDLANFRPYRQTKSFKPVNHFGSRAWELQQGAASAAVSDLRHRTGHVDAEACV